MATGETVYQLMGGNCETWGEKLPGKYGYSGVGAVVGLPIPLNWMSCARLCPTPSSWYLDMALKEAVQTMLRLLSMTTVWALSSIPPAVFSVPGKRKMRRRRICRGGAAGGHQDEG